MDGGMKKKGNAQRHQWKKKSKNHSYGHCTDLGANHGVHLKKKKKNEWYDLMMHKSDPEINPKQ